MTWEELPVVIDWRPTMSSLSLRGLFGVRENGYVPLVGAHCEQAGVPG